MTGLLLINLGTPDEPTTPAVRRYLRQFLSDPRVIDINPVGRAALLHLFILPWRPKKSAAAYRLVWMEAGSPLLVHSRALTEAVRARLPGWQVELGMRYGNPSIESAFERLRAGCDRIVVFPLYPQYSAASTGSSVEEVYRLAAQKWVTPSLSVVEPFYDDAGFLDAFAARGRALVDETKPDHVLFSFHGLPERQIRKADETKNFCLAQSTCCDAMTAENRHCYRAQSFATARAIAERLQIPVEQYSVSFQSRLGRTPWISPYTDVVIPELARAGKKRLVVFSAAFVADCLETLEEIGIRARHDFQAAGGDELVLVPSLNAESKWVDAVVKLAERYARS